MRFDLLKRYIAAAVSAVTVMSAVSPLCTVSAAEQETVYSYSFEDSQCPTAEDGDTELSIAENIGTNETKVLKINKTSTGESTKNKRTLIYPLGEHLDISGGNTYLNIKFKIYPEGTGFSAFTVTDSNKTALHTAVDADALRADEWNEVEILTNLSYSKKSGSYYVYDGNTSVKINGKNEASDTKEVKLKDEESSITDIRLKLESESGKSFVIYIDDLSLEKFTASEVTLAEGDNYTFDNDKNTVTAEEGAKAEDISAASGCTVKIYRGEDILGSEELLKTGDKIVAENSVGAQKTYTVTVVKPDHTPRIDSGTGYTVDGNKITLTSTGVTAAAMTKKKADSVRIYSDTLATSELSVNDVLTVGNMIVLSNDYETATYKIVSDKDTLYYKDFDDGVGLDFTNATTKVPIEVVTGVGGKAADDKSQKISANEIGDNTSVRSCKGSLISKADATKKYFKVDFNILSDDEKFASVMLASGWTTQSTPAVTVGDNGLVRNKWNHVTFVLSLSDMYEDGGKYRYDVTSDIYVNGKVYAEGQTKTTHPVDPYTANEILPILLRLNNTDRSDDTYVVYVDDISVTSPTAKPSIITESNAVVNTDAVFTLSSDYGYLTSTVTADALKLNGKALENYSLSVKNGTATLKLSGLSNSTAYKLTLDDGKWKDSFGRSLGVSTVKFETVSKVKVEGKFAFNKTKLATGNIKATATLLTNTTDKEQNAELIMILFKDGKIAANSHEAVTVPANGKLDKAECEIEVPDTSDGEYTLKCFLWDSLSGRISYTDYITITE